MSFTSPGLLLAGAFVVACLAAAAVLLTRRRSEALALAGLTGLSARARVPTGQWLSLGGLAVLAAAVGGPTATVPTPRAAGTVIVAMDASQSMTATDVSPTRLSAAKAAATRLVDNQPDSVDTGLVAFQSGALSAGHPSPDHAATIAAIARLTASGGTSLADAILTGLSAIVGKPVALPQEGDPAPDLGYWGSATIVLFSDGQDEGDPDRTAAAAALAQRVGVHIETVGIGTVQGTTVQSGGYTLRTALDRDTLSAIAQTTGGGYHDASDASQLDDVGDSIDRRLTVKDEPLPLAGGFAAAAAVLLALGAALTVFRAGRLI